MNTLAVYAWCFDHGTLHHFKPRQQDAWCTARWIHLDAYTEQAALLIKQRAWGDARFLHELSPEQQDTIIGRAASRPAHDGGPSVAECADNDRRWPLEREGE